MTEWRPQIYDMIGILFVGAIASFIIFFLLPISRELLFMELSSVARGLVLVVLAYTLGFLVQHTSRVLLPKQWKNSRIKESTWYSAFSEQERTAIITAVKEFYDLPDVPFTSLEHLCISPVYDRLAKRDIFVAIADYNRSMSFLAFLSGIILLVLMVINPEFREFQYYAFLVLSVIACLVFGNAYILYTRLGVIVTYSSFLSWWKEKCLRR